MNGLNPSEVKELMEYIDDNNSWRHLYKCHHNMRKVPKYYATINDTRTGDLWSIKFYEITGIGYNGPDEVEFRTDSGYDFKEAIYKWLDEPISTKKGK